MSAFHRPHRLTDLTASPTSPHSRRRARQLTRSQPDPRPSERPSIPTLFPTLDPRRHHGWVPMFREARVGEGWRGRRGQGTFCVRTIEPEVRPTPMFRENDGGGSSSRPRWTARRVGGEGVAEGRVSRTPRGTILEPTLACRAKDGWGRFERAVTVERRIRRREKLGVGSRGEGIPGMVRLESRWRPEGGGPPSRSRRIALQHGWGMHEIRRRAMPSVGGDRGVDGDRER